LKETDKAKPLYEKIIFNHEDSIYFVEGEKLQAIAGRH
jgi:hypothetical protein